MNRISVFCDMNHPGIYISLLFFAILSGSVLLVRDLKNNPGQTGGYVCPPCGCLLHDEILDAPGCCRGCGMPLISVKRRNSKMFEAVFESSEPTLYHHKFFYPVNFLALFIGFFALYRFRKELPMVLFFVFSLSLVLYSFRNQIYGTEYSMHASRKWGFFPISFLLATGPALFLYFSKTLNQDTRFSKKDSLHFMPAAVVFLLNAACFFGLESWRELAIYNNYDHFPGLSEQLTFIVSGIFYSFLIGKTIRDSEYLEPRSQQWQLQLRLFLVALILSLAAMIIGNFFYFDLMSTWLDYHPVWLLIAVFTLWSTYVLVFKKDLIFQKSIVKENRLPEDKIIAWKIALETIMQTQKPYLDPDLTLQTLAQIIGIKEKDLSEVLNIGLSKGFHDYVNYYRIEAVKNLLLMPEKQHLTNFAMAQEAGFNSKSAFFGLFKKYVGVTPGEFKRIKSLRPQ
ncbi:MAG: AraC family transcriptional regulator [Phycisphaerae bacterium]|nr:AraC family transcriptional regulator [Saprospiraceae bacterium]